MEGGEREKKREGRSTSCRSSEIITFFFTLQCVIASIPSSKFDGISNLNLSAE